MTGKILIVDDVATNRIVLRAKLAAAWYRPLLASDGATGLHIAKTEQPDLILIADQLADMDGLTALALLRADPGLSAIPILYLASCGDPDLRFRALQAGADDFIAKPIDDQLLIARLRNLVGSSAGGAEPAALTGLAEEPTIFETPGLIAMIAGAEQTTLRWQQDLTPFLAARLQPVTANQALGISGPAGPAPDVILLQADCSQGQAGLQLLSELRSRPTTRHAAICVICTGNSAAGVAMAYDLGANQVIPADFDPAELALRLTKLIRRKQHADRIRASVADSMRAAVTDDLTGLWNRRHALAHMPGIVSRSHAAGLPYSVLVVDLDRFKLVNDRYGHAAGDQVLIKVARRLTANLREGDLLARMGGEEFLVGLPDTDADQAHRIAERLCDTVNVRPCLLPDGTSLPVTVSIGLATGLPGLLIPETLADVIERADQALLRAKTAGRNRVTSAQNAA
ncbi:diguanylate cyclase [Neogemmobacter tilapiae]|uniref:diguanylate cyclase n=1 Tax=Neogemmobacter tilapiae TaxID=875041 RepID=A0A918TS88_9RHOB|nr:diguanylate cyclase [Gemmobacter tilapiae]GHC54526.1 diguanylate cyclase response regulator [Gemmobacter tilapiae]